MSCEKSILSSISHELHFSVTQRLFFAQFPYLPIELSRTMCNTLFVIFGSLNLSRQRMIKKEMRHSQLHFLLGPGLPSQARQRTAASYGDNTNFFCLGRPGSGTTGTSNYARALLLPVTTLAAPQRIAPIATLKWFVVMSGRARHNRGSGELLKLLRLPAT